MATATLSNSVEYTRDFRSAGKESKRSKDSRSKWSNGNRALPGIYMTTAGNVVGSNEAQVAKTRPGHKFSDSGHRAPKDTRNIIKGTNIGLPQGRIRSKVSAFEEIEDAARTSVLDLLPSPQKMGATDGFLYSFDNVDSPAPVLSLDVFMKTNTRETEKFVEKEYEILDANGDALKGRKARQNLRKPSNSPPAKPSSIEVVEDDFELI